MLWKPYETFDHTADVGLRIRGSDLADLFRNACDALFDLITDLTTIKDGARGRAQIAFDLALQAESKGDLLMKWLREWLFIFSTRHLIPVAIDFEHIDGTSVKANAGAVRFDPRRDAQRIEVKAITYHQFTLKQTSGGWTAEVIVDI